MLLLWFKAILQKNRIYQLWILIMNSHPRGYFCQSFLFLATLRSSELFSTSRWVWNLEIQCIISVLLLDFCNRNLSSGNFYWTIIGRKVKMMCSKMWKWLKYYRSASWFFTRFCKLLFCGRQLSCILFFYFFFHHPLIGLQQRNKSQLGKNQSLREKKKILQTISVLLCYQNHLLSSLCAILHIISASTLRFKFSRKPLHVL